ncbi:Zinc-type alcohol dehydrogenase-like protein [Tolypocladium ophioglossoides CBS 100239]|uniref:Zinc-type alcohol dehydrogenase-like protein n=1 Tax=Tolypocladium ophioglossoides (strain CBS 100239) TaxID=1163406 RepID=A0A0L0NH57_TOLOC|nr:Zinc-type alcohol dehydrogenase-like protein [Tolypocladium ophioglossoides CBS 100239]
MATQKGLLVEEAAGPFKVVDDLPRSTPGPKQALVKPIFVSMNPVDVFMQQTGILTMGMPAVLGSDFSGVVVGTGSQCTRLSKGDVVYASCNLGQNLCSPIQETFLVDEALVFKKSDNISAEQGAATGVGVLTAAFGVLVGANVTLPEAGTRVPKRDEWLVVLGGSGTVGHFGIQAYCTGMRIQSGSLVFKGEFFRRSDPALQKAAGLTLQQKVLASGADATLNNRASPADQAAEVKSITGGMFAVVFDASALAHEAAFKILEQSSAGTKHFTTTDVAGQYTVPDGVKEYHVRFGELGRDGDIGKHVTQETAKWTPVLAGHIAQGTITPVELEVYDGNGWQALIEAFKCYAHGKAKKKVVVRVQNF